MPNCQPFKKRIYLGLTDLCLKLIYIYIVDQNTYYNVCQSGLEICSTIRVHHIEFGKFGLNVAVLCSTSDRVKQMCRPIQMSPAQFWQMALPFWGSLQIELYNSIARGFGTGDTIICNNCD